MNASAETLEWVMTYYKSIHDNDFDTVMEYFTPDARVRFGNGDFVVGRQAIREDYEAKHRGFRSLTHHFNRIWDVGDGWLVLDADNEFVRLDGATVRVYAAGLFRYEGQQWTEQLHFGDLSLVFSSR